MYPFETRGNTLRIHDSKTKLDKKWSEYAKELLEDCCVLFTSCSGVQDDDYDMYIDIFLDTDVVCINIEFINPVCTTIWEAPDISDLEYFKSSVKDILNDSTLMNMLNCAGPHIIVSHRSIM